MKDAVIVSTERSSIGGVYKGAFNVTRLPTILARKIL